jgi:hypothetical protein
MNDLMADWVPGTNRSRDMPASIFSELEALRVIRFGFQRRSSPRSLAMRATPLSCIQRVTIPAAGRAGWASGGRKESIMDISLPRTGGRAGLSTAPRSSARPSRGATRSC